MITVSFGDQKNEPQSGCVSWGHIIKLRLDPKPYDSISYTMHSKNKQQSWHKYTIKLTEWNSLL